MSQNNEDHAKSRPERKHKYALNPKFDLDDEEDIDRDLLDILGDNMDIHKKPDQYKRSSKPSDPKEKPPKEQKSYPSEKVKESLESQKPALTKPPSKKEKDLPLDPVKSKPSKQLSEASSKRKEDRTRERDRLAKQRYREPDDSEFSVHFYIQNVYLSPHINIDDFLNIVRERINKAGACEDVRVAHYYENEVKLSVGMKYDRDALSILNRKRMILLYSRENKLYETKPIISPSFEVYLGKKEAGAGSSTRKHEKASEKRRYGSSSRSRSHSRSKRQRNKSDDSRKKDSGHNHNYIRSSHYEKNLMKNPEKRYRSKSGSRSRDEQSKKNAKYQRKPSPDSHYKSRKSPISSRSRSQRKKIRSRSRSRALEHSPARAYSNKIEKKYPKTQPSLPFKDEKPVSMQLDQPNALPLQSQPQPLFQTAGNMPIVDNNSSNLLNMAYVMNQQLVQTSFESKPEFVQYAAAHNPHHNIAALSMPPSNQQYNPAPIEPAGVKELKKESSELLFGGMEAASLGASNNEGNLEGQAYSHASASVSALNPVVKTNNFTITNKGNKKVINISRKKETATPAAPVNLPTTTLQPEPVTNDCICYLLGIPQSFSINEVLFAIKQLNSEIEKVTPKEEIEKYLIDNPVDYQWEQSNDMEYLKVIFPNTKSTDNLIVHSLKIMQNSIIVLPFFPNKPLIDLLDYHEIKILTSPKVDQLLIYHSFSNYGDIVNIIEEPCNNGSSFIIVYAHHNSVKSIKPSSQQNYQLQLENGENINVLVQRMEKPIPVKRPAANETISARFNYSTINLIQQNYQKNEYKAISNPAAHSQSLQTIQNIQPVKLPPLEMKKIEPEKEKIELKREKIESPMTLEPNLKQEKKPYKPMPQQPQQQQHHYKNYNRNYSESPQNYKYNNNNKGYHQDNYNRGNYRDNYHNNNNNRDYNNNQRKNYQSSNRNEHYKNYSRDKYYDNNNNMNRNYQNRRNNY